MEYKLFCLCQEGWRQENCLPGQGPGPTLKAEASNPEPEALNAHPLQRAGVKARGRKINASTFTLKTQKTHKNPQNRNRKGRSVRPFKDNNELEGLKATLLQENTCQAVAIISAGLSFE